MEGYQNPPTIVSWWEGNNHVYEEQRTHHRRHRGHWSIDIYEGYSTSDEDYFEEDERENFDEELDFYISYKKSEQDQQDDYEAAAYIASLEVSEDEIRYYEEFVDICSNPLAEECYKTPYNNKLVDNFYPQIITLGDVVSQRSYRILICAEIILKTMGLDISPVQSSLTNI